MSGRIDSLIVKIAERCNLNCSYCYMYQHEDKSYLKRPKFLDETLWEHLLLRVREYNQRHAPHHMTIVFHGGEPTLIGPERLDRYMNRAYEVLGEDHRGNFGMQTNATLLNAEWIKVIRRHDLQIGVSLDGTEEVHDAVRVDHQGRGSHAATLGGLRQLQEAGLEPGILCVINPGHSGLEVYRYFRSLNIKKMSFLLPDVSHDHKQRLYGEYGETPVADYLLPIFDAWYAEDDPDVRIRDFWQFLTTLLRSPHDLRLTFPLDSESFGNPLMSYLVIETDGTIQANDALRVCQEGLTLSGLNIATDGFDDLHRGLPLVHRLAHEGIPLAEQCQHCPEKEICGGGFLPHRYAHANGFDNPSVWCKDLLKIFTHIRACLGRIPDYAIA